MTKLAAFVALLVLAAPIGAGAQTQAPAPAQVQSQQAPPQQAQPTRPVLVELFTSQGCNSCPPAETFLRELSQRNDLIAIELHVDYWDYIGWRDPFASRALTHRQRAYSRAMEQRYVYTPQMIIDGRFQEVGSDREAVLRLIERARAAKPAGPTIEAIAPHGDAPPGVRISGPVPSPAVVWAAALDPAHETDVLRGENGGQRLVNTNVVRRLERIGTYDGTAIELPLFICEPHQSLAVVVQAANGTGPILAAKLLPPLR
jgi:hypothetical protein